MRGFLLFAVSGVLSAQTPPGPASEQHTFQFRNFKTESGVTLPEALVFRSSHR